MVKFNRTNIFEIYSKYFKKYMYGEFKPSFTSKLFIIILEKHLKKQYLRNVFELTFISVLHE